MIVTISQTSAPSSSGEKCRAAASSQSASGTCVSATRVIVSVNAERRALAVVEQRGFPPDGEQGEALVALAGAVRASAVCMFDAVGAAVQLRGSEPHELTQTGVEADAVELLGGGAVQAVHGRGERRRVAVEVEADADLRWSVMSSCPER